ncbi:sialidase family protein [Microlunatus panaciterrae]
MPAGSTAPVAGTCRPGPYNANHSESWIAVKPGTEDLLGASKIFFDKYSTFYLFHLGAMTMPNATPTKTTQVQGYDCVSTGSQAMPPSWTNNTDPNVAFDSQGRAYQVTLPFNAYWDGTKLHPDGAIDLSYSDDLGRTWLKGNGGQDLEQSPNASAKQLGHVEDKQWVAVNALPGSPYRDHVYAMWSVFNNNTTKIRIAVSRDRGQTFAKAVTMTAPSQTGPSNTYVYPSVDAAGNLYVAFASFPMNRNRGPVTIFVTRSTDDGVSFSPFVAAATVGTLPTAELPNTTFRDGITESFAASPTHAGHLYLTYEDWVGTQMDVKFTQSTDGGLTWSDPTLVNDNSDAGVATDQFQPSVAAGPEGAVAVAFYDRRAACPNDPSVLAADVGRTNFCIATSLQAYKDTGSGAKPVASNTRISDFTWDPMNPAQHLDGIGQMACAGHSDPCTSGALIGDYFGLAISGRAVYGLFVSTHYPSSVIADEGGPIYYQQQVLATVARSDIARDY